MEIEKTFVAIEEQETNINIEPLTKKASVYSCVPATVKKLYQLAAESDDCVIVQDDQYGLTVEVPMKWVHIKKPITRVLTEEQKAIASERMKAFNAKKKQENS